MIRRFGKNIFSVDPCAQIEARQYCFADGGEDGAASGGGGGADDNSGDDGSSEGAGDGGEGKAASSENNNSLLGKKDEEGDNPDSKGTTDKKKEVKLFANKFKTTEDLEAGYKELTKKLTESGKIAPEKYELSLPEGLQLADADNDPLLKSFSEVAKKHNLNNDAYNDLIALKLQADAESVPNFENEMAKLGDNAQQLVSGLDNYLKSNLSADEYNVALNVATTAEGVLLLDKLRKMGESTKLPGDNVDKQAARATPEQAEEALAKAREAEKKDASSPEAIRLRKEAQRLFKEAYPE